MAWKKIIMTLLLAALIVSVLAGIAIIAVPAMGLLGASGSFSPAGGASNLVLQQNYQGEGTGIVSSDPFFSGPSCSLVVAVDGSSRSAQAMLTPDAIAALTGGYAPNGSVSLRTDLVDEKCTNTLSNQPPVPVYAYAKGQYCGNQQEVCTDSRSFVSCMTIEACNAAGGTRVTGAQDGIVVRRKIGEIFFLSSETHYEYQVNSSITTNSGSYSVLLSNTAKNQNISGVLRAYSLYGGQGDSSCPVPAANTVLFRKDGSNVLVPKASALLSQVLAANTQGDYSMQNVDRDYANLIANNFLSSPNPESAYCPDSVTSGTTTQYSCTPRNPVYIPVIKYVLKCSALQEVYPSSVPKIEGISSPLAGPGNTTSVDIVVRNAGAETDSFDISVSGKHQVSIQNPRVSLAPNATATVSALVQGAGIIGTYTATAASVNSPDRKDSVEFRLTIDPFCDRQAEPGKTKVSTEYGCAYVCPNAYLGDVREKDCGAAIYNRSIEYAQEFHCTGIGEYRTLNGYLDGVYAGALQPFIPAQKEHAYWLGAPYCNYWAEYGFHWNGFAADLLGEADYYSTSGSPMSVPAQGTQQNAPQAAPSPSQPPTTPPARAPPPSPVTAPGAVAGFVVAFLGLVALAALAFLGYKAWTKRK